jgi:hypothetical protein
MTSIRLKKIAFDSSKGEASEHLHFERGAGLHLKITCNRPLRLWVGRLLVVDEDLHFRLQQKQMHLDVFVPVEPGAYDVMAEFGERPRHMGWVDEHCPSKNRAFVLEENAKRFPDRCELDISVSEEPIPAACLRYGPAQLKREGILWQEVLVREINGLSPMNRELEVFGDSMMKQRFYLSSEKAPGLLLEAEPSPVQSSLGRRFYVPIAAVGEVVPRARRAEKESRVEPVREMITSICLSIEDGFGKAEVKMPVFESTGKLAPLLEYKRLEPPSRDKVMRAIPVLKLPESWNGLKTMYHAAWTLLCELWEDTGELSGLPNGYVRTAMEGFENSQFLWDTSFTTLATRYAWRNFPTLASYDCLYSRQQDGGYLQWFRQ